MQHNGADSGGRSVGEMTLQACQCGRANFTICLQICGTTDTEVMLLPHIDTSDSQESCPEGSEVMRTISSPSVAAKFGRPSLGPHLYSKVELILVKRA